MNKEVKNTLEETCARSAIHDVLQMYSKPYTAKGNKQQVWNHPENRKKQGKVLLPDPNWVSRANLVIYAWNSHVQASYWPDWHHIKCEKA